MIAINDQLPVDFATLETMPDPRTDPRLLPGDLAPRDNARKMRHYKAALRRGMVSCLTPVQRDHICLFYGGGLRKSEIASLKHITCSAVSKSIKAGKSLLKAYITMYMDIYDDLEREFLRDEAPQDDNYDSLEDNHDNDVRNGYGI